MRCDGCVGLRPNGPGTSTGSTTVTNESERPLLDDHELPPLTQGWVRIVVAQLTAAMSLVDLPAVWSSRVIVCNPEVESFSCLASTAP